MLISEKLPTFANLDKIAAFAYIFTAIITSLFLQGRLSTMSWSHEVLKLF